MIPVELMLLSGNGLWPPLRIANGQLLFTSVTVTCETSSAEAGAIMHAGFSLARDDQYELMED